MSNTIKKVGETEIFKGQRVHLFEEHLEMPDGKVVTWELIKHVGAAAVIPVDDQGQIIMVRQYRNAVDGETLEIPAGVLDHKSEDPYACAVRELKEETGYTAEDIQFLYKFYSSIGICDEVIHVYVATGLTSGEQDLDTDEYVTLSHFELDDLINMIFTGELVDNKTISALLVYQHHIRQQNNQKNQF